MVCDGIGVDIQPGGINVDKRITVDKINTSPFGSRFCILLKIERETRPTNSDVLRLG